MTILVVGDANADLSAALVRFPAEGDDSQITGLEWGSGGSAANVAAALGWLGAPTRLLSRVGRDPAAEIALRVARAAGVGLECLQIDATIATGLCFAAVSPGGERTFFSFRGANVAMAPIAGQDLAGISWVHLSAYALLEGRQRESAWGLIELAALSNIPISLDLGLPALRAWRAEFLDLLPRLSILFANEQELAALCPGVEHAAAAEQLVGGGLALAAIKLGPRGALIAGPGRRFYAPTFDVAAVDTNGCGDAFVAGFLFAHRRGASLEQCSALANALGALTATRYGAAAALPTRAQLRAFLRAQPGVPAIEHLLGEPSEDSIPAQHA
jgi:sugar/nucleoside kinase (ribokinase family)